MIDPSLKLQLKRAYYGGIKCDRCDYARCVCGDDPDHCAGPYMPYSGGMCRRMNRYLAEHPKKAKKAQP